MTKHIKMEFKGKIFNVDVERKDDFINITRDGKDYSVQILPEEISILKNPLSGKVAAPVTTSAPAGAVSGGITAPMTGLIKDILVKTGATVKAGQIVAILEAMKMDIEIRALSEGIVKEIHAHANNNVTRAQLLMSID